MSEKKHIFVELPVKLAQEIAALVGPRGRNAFFIEILEREVKKRTARSEANSKAPVYEDGIPVGVLAPHPME